MDIALNSCTFPEFLIKYNKSPDFSGIFQDTFQSPGLLRTCGYSDLVGILKYEYNFQLAFVKKLLAEIS